VCVGHGGPQVAGCDAKLLQRAASGLVRQVERGEHQVLRAGALGALPLCLRFGGLQHFFLGGLLSAAMLSGATMVFTAQHFQLVDGLSTLQAGLALLPGMATSIVIMQVTPVLARYIRPAYLIGAGLAVTVIGMGVIAQSSPADGPTTLMIGFAITCLGGGPLVGLGTDLIMGSVPPEKAGPASGVLQTNSDFGYALGIAVGVVVRRMRVGHAARTGTCGTHLRSVRKPRRIGVRRTGRTPSRPEESSPRACSTRSRSPSEESCTMTATYTFDIFSTLDGFGSYNGDGDRGGYWGKQGPEFLDRRLALYSEDQLLVFGANTYRQFVELLGSSDEESKVDDPVNARLRSLPATVVSSTPHG
jgi:hypothetical protein